MNQRGFTLSELVVTISILAILFAIALPATREWRERAGNKGAARQMLTWLRQARSEAVTDSQTKQVTLDLTAKTFTGFNGIVVDLPTAVVEARRLTTADWQGTGSFPLTFFPKGSCSDTLFIRIENDDNLVIRLESTATGLARM